MLGYGPILVLSVVLSCSALAQQATEAVVDPTSAQEHYARVERELRARDVRHLSQAQQERRLQVIDLLRAYRERAVFGVNRDFPGRREPYFVDATGRRCAVAWLLDGTGYGALTLRVAEKANHGWVVELAGDPDLRQWLECHGIALWEAARIQVPGSGQWSGNNQPSEPPPPPPEYDGPEDGISTIPVPGSGGGSAGSTGRPGSASIPGAARSPAPARAAPRGTALTDLGAESWTEWWGWNRRLLLPPRTWKPDARTVTGTASFPVERVRAEAIPLLREGLGHADARVRASAALALARVAGGEALSDIERMLDDPSAQVRGTAVLALGASGSPTAVHQLLHLAHGTGEAVGGGGAHARPLAILSLGLAMRGKDTMSVAPLIDRLIDDASPGEEETVVAAAFAFTRMTGAADLLESAAARVTDTDRDALQRARAADSVIGATDREVIAALTRGVSARRVDLRRSAALSLGQARHPLALPALMTAFELEKELLTRAFALIAIGRHGGHEARRFLLEQVESGRKPLRAWAGLGLGLLCRSDPRPESRAALRAAAGRERNRDLVGAWFVALGLAQDVDSVERMAAASRDAKSSLVRAGAVEGLALIGDPRGLPALRAALATDRCPFVRGAAADGLGHAGDASDAARLAAAIAEERDPANRSRLAAALGGLGTQSAWRELRELHGESDDDPALRAAVLQAIGGLVACEPERLLPGLSSLSNFTLFPGWLAWALRHDL